MNADVERLQAINKDRNPGLYAAQVRLIMAQSTAGEVMRKILG